MEKARMAVKLVNLQLVAVLVAVFVTVMSGGVALGLECMDCHLSSGITTAGAEKCAGLDDQMVHNVFLDKTVDNASSYVGLDQLSATTYYVPDDFYTIQEAIDEAIDWDEIIVRDGTYSEHIDFSGKKITVRSENGPFRTTINGDPNTYTYIVSFWSSEGAYSVLDGFFITNGNGGFGGGISCYAAEPTISNCIITGNTGGFGGGIFLCDWGGDAAATIINCLITDNESSEAGGGIYCGDTAPTIINCTIIGNSTTGDGGGIRSYGDASPTVFNTILWANTADGSPDEISVSESSLIDITYSDIQGGDPDNPGSPYPGIGNILCDPAFVRRNGDYHLTGSSCCIDTGTDVGAPDYDIDGDIRPQGNGYDMGADEFQPVVAPGKHGKP
jgi:Right handed beta helix region